ncbi:metallophosphoesterase [Caballeronia sp. ATUFL_M2_KS44]|uniref:metallophosphoesterase n=1 Tax=Caballeronia sp. ATUFL_M2_KS44 TaxID=2921767 RepID=UPI002027847F|nr:metallophosphoesterase [Caballeronia sp. ATUFL_M2_KS44]
MRLQIASDLHFERLAPEAQSAAMLLPTACADILILAGDVSRSTDAVRRFASWPRPVLLVHGNHEARSGHLIDLSRSMTMQAVGTSVIYLEQTTYECGGVRFLGCCLWSSFDLYGAPAAAMKAAEAHMPEYGLYRVGRRGAFSPKYSHLIHRKSRSWLETEIAKPFAGRTVVVTHHAPHPRSIAPQYAGGPLNPAFASDLSELMTSVDLWVHGHLHTSSDYLVGRCRVVCNPRGYPLPRRDGGLEFENREFNPQLVVSI